MRVQGDSVPSNGSAASLATVGRRLRLGDQVPDFIANSSHGQLHFHQWIQGHWVMLFSHPATFTPVCATEVGEVAMVQHTLESKGFKLAALSCEYMPEPGQWEADIAANNRAKARPDFPLIYDSSREVAVKFGMIDPDLKDKYGLPLTSRTLFIIGTDKLLKLSISYPAAVGRDIRELLRVCDALQLTSRECVATPASWPDNHANLVVGGKSMEGCVFLLSSDSGQDVQRFSQRHELEMPSGRRYMRLVCITQEEANVCDRVMRFVAYIISLIVAVASWVAQRWRFIRRRRHRRRTRSASGIDRVDRSRFGSNPRQLDIEKQYVEEVPLYSTPEMARLVKVETGGVRSQSSDVPPSVAAAELDNYLNSMDGQLRLGDHVPEFTAETTMGTLDYHQWITDKWAILFTHPGAFTPVCTTEIGTLAMMHTDLASKGFRVAALSCSRIDDLIAWRRDISAHFDNAIQVPFPLISDPAGEVAAKYGMIDRGLSLQLGAPHTSRQVFIIGPDKKLKASLNYPVTVGHSIHEIMRVCDALQMSARESVATPASWPNNHVDLVVDGKSMKGCVFLLPTVSDEDAEQFFPDRVELNMPSGLKYARLTHIKSDGKLPLCEGCAAFGRR